MTDNNKNSGAEVQDENSLYLDCLENSDEDIADLQKINSGKATKGDRIYVSVMAALNIAVLVFIGVFLIVTGNTNEFESIKVDSEPKPEVTFFDAKKVFSGELAPTINGVIFPDGMQSAFRRIYSENQDVIGWIRLNGTSIDYPVMQAEDNKKYERATFYLDYSKRGSIWMDYRCRVGVNRNWFYKNTIIYGHHLSADECIFAELEKYMDVEFYKTHPVIEMNTIYENYKWKVFACIVTNVNEKDDNGHVFYYWNPYVSDENTPAFTDEILRRSWFINPAVSIEASDKLLCLSTCTYIMNANKYYDMRCVVFARLVRDGEDETVDVSGAYQNENKRMPQVWYNQNSIENPYKNIAVYGE
ncbi:MAG: class B sortase [Oscillospiraceae bacterium]|nr:class B sortase [Oscillospiraceae bacterium]